MRAMDGTAFADVTLRRLEKNGCLAAEGLWREVFSEDTEAFTSYYFSQKAAENRGLVLEGPEGIRSMLYLTPERMRVLGKEVASSYLVGVATREVWRHRGYMAALLKEAMALLRREGMPFCFLMPASPKIYAPFGFAYIYDRPVWDASSLRKERLTRLSEQNAKRAAAFAEDFLSTHKGVYVFRDQAYYRQQAAELAAQNGCIYGYEEDGVLRGLCMYTCEEGSPEILEVLAEKGIEERFVLRRREKRPLIMARILHVPAALALLKSCQRRRFAVEVKDPFLSDNNGVFFCDADGSGTDVETLTAADGWKRTEDGLSLERGGERIPLLSADPARLTEWIFSYRPLPEEIKDAVRPLAPVWINETV